jgi:alpha-amylase
VYTIPSATCSSIIFSNNGATQTADLSRCNEGWYSNGTWYDINPDLVTSLKIHLKTTWTTPKIYFWNATPGGAATTWPGVSMTSEGNGWFVYTIPNAACSSIIFSNNGATQTADLSRCNEGWYSSGTWYSAQPAGRTELNESLNENDAIYIDHYPNPATNSVIITFTIKEASHVNLKILNDQGCEVMTVVNTDLHSGQHEVEVNTSALQSGLYLYRIVTRATSKVKKLMIIK